MNGKVKELKILRSLLLFPENNPLTKFPSCAKKLGKFISSPIFVIFKIFSGIGH